MNTPNHATDAQIDALWALLQLETARNFVQAYRNLQQESDEKNDPRNYAGKEIKNETGR